MRRRRPRRHPRSIMVGLGETAGYCSQLAEGFRSLGIRADHLDLGPDRYGYGTAHGPLVRLARALAARRANRSWPAKLWVLLHRAVMAWLFVVAVLRYDAFVLRAGDSFMSLRDLPLLRRLGKRVVVVFFGSDSRPPYMNGSEVARGINGRAAAATTAAKRRMVERIEADAGEVVCHVLTAQLHHRPSVAFLQVGIPRRVPAYVPPPPLDAGTRPIRVLHAPSDPSGKGTDAIRSAADRLRGRGVNVELTVMTGQANRDVLAALDACDFVVDALHSDTPMAGFAAEAAARGRPAVVGGYGWAELRRLTPEDVLPPSHLVAPDEIEDGIARLAGDHAYRLELGARARRFMERRWNPTAVAQRMLAVVTGETPPAWYFDPVDVHYAYGVGLTTEMLAESVRSVIATAAGPDALQVADKPAVQQELLELAATGDAA